MNSDNYNLDLKNYIHFKVSIPFDFEMDKTNFIVQTKAIDKDENKKRRTIIFYFKRHYVENQSVPATNSIISTMKFDNSVKPNEDELDLSFLKYSYFISYFDIRCELLAEEYEQFDDSNEYIKVCSFILQNILNVLANHFNETRGGNLYFKPNVNYYGPFFASVYKENELYCPPVISVSYSLNNMTKSKVKNITEGTIMPWRLYFNRAKNAFMMLDNLDAILFSAISIESYVMWLIRNNNLENKLDILRQNKGENGSISFFEEVKVLKENGIIDNSKAKDLKSTYGKFKDFRNKIVHGDLNSYYVAYEEAGEAIALIVLFYKKYEEGKNI